MTPGTSAIEVRSRDGSTRFVDVVGIPSPKDGCPLGAGLEHVEFARIARERRCPSSGSHGMDGDASFRASANGEIPTYPRVWNSRITEVCR